MAIHPRQEARQVGKQWWRWAIWIDGTDQELDGVESVTYYLHSTFRDPVRTVSDRDNKFRLNGSGWGTFTVRIEVEHDDGSTSNLEHELDFDGAPSKEEMQAEAGDPEPTRRVLVLSTHDTQSVADEVIESLSGAGIVVSDPGSLAGAPWSKELLEAIRSVDEVVTVGNADRIQYRIEADMAEKLGKRIWRIETPTDTPNETPTVTTASHGSRPTRALSFDADLLRGGGLVEAFRKKS